ncbi:hypothetical protein JKG68_10710 [Microvirga aerilata]|uniref:PD-(D/E)XK nuclease family protein n=1 Tax=Microvirga aerilata TaxID=670292 RepID=A0A936ZGT5_9HYPH|nr:hypothetical protein [Microvirga aerilata]MBL0404439.1 hypothetical protein [Microvirga aerilata]
MRETRDETQGRPAVLERDVDALLIRRLRTDAGFAANLIDAVSRQAGIALACERVGIDAQVRHEGTSGTIDVLLRLFTERSGETGRILIENKLDSSFTPGQPERYESSAAAMSRSGRPAVPVICAPADYLKRSRHVGPFKAHISYENVCDWTDGEDALLMQAAIRRFAMPYEPDPVPEVQDFHEGYWQLVRELAPELIVKPNPNTGGERPEASRTVYFVTKKTLPGYDFLPTLRFSHQCWDASAPSASVKIMFDGWAAYEPLLQRRAREALGHTGLYLRRAGRSLGLVHDTPRLDNKRPVNTQLDAVASGIRAASKLRAWMFANEPTLREWASAVAASADQAEAIS